jgi:hypothetical protein
MREPRHHAPRNGRDDAEPHTQSFACGIRSDLGHNRHSWLRGPHHHRDFAQQSAARRARRADLGEHDVHNGATLLAFAGHLVEIALWALVLNLSGAVADISAAIYASAGSYTTSGSDIVLPPRWKLLGPLEAVAGMLMFGVSTAFIFAVIQRLLHAQFRGEDDLLP